MTVGQLKHILIVLLQAQWTATQMDLKVLWNQLPHKLLNKLLNQFLNKLLNQFLTKLLNPLLNQSNFAFHFSLFHQQPRYQHPNPNPNPSQSPFRSKCPSQVSLAGGKDLVSAQCSVSLCFLCLWLTRLVA